MAFGPKTLAVTASFDHSGPKIRSELSTDGIQPFLYMFKEWVLETSSRGLYDAAGSVVIFFSQNLRHNYQLPAKY